MGKGASPRRPCEQVAVGESREEPMVSGAGGTHVPLSGHQGPVALRRHLGRSQHPPPSVPKPPPCRVWDQSFELGPLFVVDGL